MEEKKESFHYTYSAKQQEEIQSIRKKYLPQEDDIERVRPLGRRATTKGAEGSVIVGFISCLLLGIGMCCTMVWMQWFVPGVVIGVIGIVGIAAAYPLYTRITRRERERLAPQILKLTEELSRAE